MGVPISNVTRRVVYAASGTGPYNFTFEILAVGDVAVYKDDALLTLTTDYTVTINSNGTGFITLVASPTGATQIAIVGNRTIQRTTDFVTGGDFFANTVNDEMDQQTIFAQQNAEGLQRALQAPQTDPTTIDMTLPRASVRANKTLAFDTDGNPTTGEVIGDNRGTWASGTAYNKRDIVKDSTNSNIYYANTSHTSTGSLPISTNADSGKWDLLVDAEAAGDAQNAAEAAQAAAETAETNAETAATAAASSASAAASSASAASSSASAASTSATNAASSASTASTAATNAGNSATAAATSATNASNSASAASTSATNASTSATNASNSATAASTSASNASTSATNASNSASAASTSASNASTSATNAASSATSAAASAAAAAASFDAFDDIYLGAKSSDPSVDNDGNALTVGDQYFNTSANELRVYNGSTWQAASTVGGTVTSLSVTGATTLGQNPTLSAGTANGVAYLNGSKVLTTGSALTFDGTNLATTGNMTVNGANGYNVQVSGGNAYRMYATTNDLVFRSVTAGSDVMTLTYGGNVGIGTSSPGAILDISKSSSGGSTGDYPSVRISNPNTTTQSISDFQARAENGNVHAQFAAVFSGGERYVRVAALSNHYLQFMTNSTERARIDSIGNLLIADTTQAGAPFNNKLFVNGTASMRSAFSSYVSEGLFAANARPSTILTPSFASLRFGYQDDGGGQYNPAIGFRAPSTLGTGQTDYSNAIWATTNGALAFGTGTAGSYSERARITSGGELLVGTTTQQGRLTVVGGTGLVQSAHIEHPGGYSALQIKATDGAFADNVLLLAANRGASSAFQFIRGGANGVDQFRVAGNGVIFAQNTTVQSISDQRLKENIRDSSDGLDVITALRPVRYDWKEGYGNDRKDQLGFIAQEVEAVFPEAVSEWQVSREDETVYKTVGPGALIPVLVKAIQELKAEFDAYKASHP